VCHSRAGGNPENEQNVMDSRLRGNDRKKANNRKKICGPIFIILIGFSLGYVRSTYTEKYDEQTFAKCDRQKVELSGDVVSRVEEKDFYKTALIEVGQTKELSCVYSTETRYSRKTILEARLPLTTEIERGDSVSVSGTLSVPESFVTDSDVIFEYGKYLHAKDIDLILKNAEIVSKTSHKNFFSWVDSFHSKLVSILRTDIREPSASLASGVVLGEKNGLSRSLKDSLTKSGLIHIAVLSGYNITLASDFAYRVGSLAGPFFGGIFSAIGILFYGTVAGWEAPVIRAVLMALIALLASLGNRRSRAFALLVLVGALYAIFNPLGFIFDPSFHLSFIATFGIILFPPILEKFLVRFISWKFLLQELSTTLSAYIAVVPYISYSMGNVSFVAPVANILVAPLVPISMFASTITIVAHSVLKPLGLFSGFITELPLKLIIYISDVSSSLPWGFENIHVSLLVLVGVYLALISIILIKPNIRYPRP